MSWEDGIYTIGMAFEECAKKRYTLEEHVLLCFEPLTWIGPGVFNQRRIVSAANKYTLTDGRQVVIPCVRHSSKELHKNIDIFIEQGLLTKKTCYPDDQGFVDQYCNWWSREDAFIIARVADQVNLERNSSKDELYSEGLY